MIYIKNIIKENNLNNLFECFDFYEEFNNNKEYNFDIYKYDYGNSIRKYKNVIYNLAIEKEGVILYNVEYVVAREIFDLEEIKKLQIFCPCDNCLKINSNPIYKESFENYCIKKYCIKQYTNKFLITPLVQEARKIKINSNQLFL